MGRSGSGGTTRKRKPYCKPCMKSGVRRHPDAIGLKGNGVIMRCYCGHEYVSYSKTALRHGDMLKINEHTPNMCPECNTQNLHYSNGNWCCAFCGSNGKPADATAQDK